MSEPSHQNDDETAGNLPGARNRPPGTFWYWRIGLVILLVFAAILYFFEVFG